LGVGGGGGFGAGLVEAAVYRPRRPILVPFGSAHSRRSNRFPRSVSKTFDLSQVGTPTRCHTCLFGRGNARSKDEENLSSDREWVAEPNRARAFVGRDAMSAMTFSSPLTCTVVSLPAWWVYSIKDSPRSRLPATADFDFDAILLIQLTVGVLSQSVPRVACLICGALARIMPTANSSAASSRSELVMPPVGLLSDTTLLAMSCGNSADSARIYR
jgi:hypothetical protein